MTASPFEPPWWALCIGTLLGLGALATQARSLTEIEHSGEIRFCLRATDPSTFGPNPLLTPITIAEPPGCRDDCTVFKGFSYDTVMAFMGTLASNIEPKFVRLANWDEQFHNAEGKTVREASYTPALLESGTCDIYPQTITKRDWRLTKFDIVTLYVDRPMVVTRKSTETQFQKTPDLSGKTAVVLKNSIDHGWLSAQNESGYAADPVKLVFADNFSGLFLTVANGEADFLLAETILAFWFTRSSPRLKNLVGTIPVGDITENGWGLRKQDRDLQQAVRHFFETQRADLDSDLNRLWKKHFGLTLPEHIELVTLTE